LQQEINEAKLKFDALLIQEGIINERNDSDQIQIREKNEAVIDMLQSEYGFVHELAEFMATLKITVLCYCEIKIQFL
jgi:hypothetical protein